MKHFFWMMTMLAAFLPAVAAPPVNLALGVQVTASDEDAREPGCMRPEKAVDGNWNSRWSTGPGSSTAWLLIDLGESKQIGEIKLQWEYAGAKEYAILLSEDGEHFTEAVWKKDGKHEESVSFPLVPAKARFVKLDCRKRLTSYGYSLYEIELYNRTGNLAFGSKATASSVEKPQCPPEAAVDGDCSTRWSSARKDNQWLLLELPEAKTIAGIVLNWERAAAREFTVQFSQDGKTFTDVCTETNGTPGLRTIEIEPQTAKFVRINCLRRLTPYGFSLFDVQLFGPRE